MSSLRKSKPLLLICALLVVALVLGLTVLADFDLGFVGRAESSSRFRLTIIHTNDIHARADQFDKYGNECDEQEQADGSCFGGAARVAGFIDSIRKTEKNSILLDAGDRFQGTLYYNRFKGEIESTVMNAAGYDAMVLGNHEFDDGSDVLAKFIDDNGFPVLGANIQIEPSSPLAEKIEPYRILWRGGRKIGVFGLITEESSYISNPGKGVEFTDALSAARLSIQKLRAEAVDIIICLSHLGLNRDIELAKSVDGIDVVVGGHTHSVLGSWDNAAGPYPISERTPNGGKTLIVTAGSYGKYIGHLDLVFNGAGEITSYKGRPALLDSTYPQNPHIKELVDGYSKDLVKFRHTVVGTSSDLLAGDDGYCRFFECNQGNLITDALLWEARADNAQIAFFNGGGIRKSIPAGEITLGQIIEALPFGNTLAVVTLRGSDIKAALEHSVGRADDPNGEGTGRFLQVSGLTFSWDPEKPVGSRVSEIIVDDGDNPAQKLNNEKIYRVAMTDFLRRGGDGFEMFKRGAIEYYDYGRVASDIYIDYLASFSPISPKTEGRIARLN